MSKPEEIEHIARLLAKMEGNDPDKSIAPPDIVPWKIRVMGRFVNDASGQFAPVPLWHAYAEHARNLLNAGLIDP
jgi:hypothetical protein